MNSYRDFWLDNRHMGYFLSQFLRNKDNFNKLNNNEINYKKYIKIIYTKANKLPMRKRRASNLNQKTWMV